MYNPDIYSKEITAEILLKAYQFGIFPMAESADDDNIFWVEPNKRGIIPLDKFHISRRLLKKIRQGGWEISIDAAFKKVISECAKTSKNRKTTWINDKIIKLYTKLHELERCHSIEVWYKGELAGGLYGVQIGAAFFGESMFTKITDGSKIALAYLVEHLKEGEFKLLDTQFINDHLKSMGAIEISKAEYNKLLEEAIYCRNNFSISMVSSGIAESLSLHSTSQTS